VALPFGEVDEQMVTASLFVDGVDDDVGVQ